MTSEIAVLNQRAVALAADRPCADRRRPVAVATTSEIGQSGRGQAIAIISFGVADVMAIPGSIDRALPKECEAAGFPHVADYANSFWGRRQSRGFFPRARQDDEYRRLLASVFRYLFQYAQYLGHG